MNKLFKTFAKHFGREDAITIVKSVNSNSSKRGGDDDDQVKIISIEYSDSDNKAIVTFNKDTTLLENYDIIRHLKIFVMYGVDPDTTAIYLLNRVSSDNNIHMSLMDVEDNYYTIIRNGNQLIIEHNSLLIGYTLGTICWL